MILVCAVSIAHFTIFPSLSTVTATATESTCAAPSFSPASADLATDEITARPVFTASAAPGSVEAVLGAVPSVLVAVPVLEVGSEVVEDPQPAIKVTARTKTSTSDSNFFIVVPPNRYYNILFI